MNIFALCWCRYCFWSGINYFLVLGQRQAVIGTGKWLLNFILLGMYLTAALGLRVVIGGNSSTAVFGISMRPKKTPYRQLIFRLVLIILI